jgi:hypothetical protein
MNNLQDIRDELNRLQEESDNTTSRNKRHRYVFEKYNPKIGKHVCPKCEKKTFVYYQDAFNNYQIISPIVGKCERIIECEYWLTPYQYFIENSIEEPESCNNININNGIGYDALNSNKNDTLNDNELLIQCDYIPEKYFKPSFKNCANSFTVFLHEYLNKDTQKLLDLIKMYNIGTGKNTDDVVLWQVDIENNIRTGKIMRFNEKGKRWKNYIDWAHLRVKIDDYTLKQCLYGEHLLTHYPKARQIIIVESEKTAVILKSEYMGDNNIIVMATGGQQDLTLDRFKVFEDRAVEITLIPDVGAQSDWKRKMKIIRLNLKLDIELYDPNQFIIMNFNDDFTLESGEDIADYLIQKRLGLEYITGESYITKK